MIVVYRQWTCFHKVAFCFALKNIGTTWCFMYPTYCAFLFDAPRYEAVEEA
jgi:hypothetical protein